MRDVNKILVVTLSNIGDVVLTLPVIGALRESFKDAAIDVLVSPRAQEIFKGDPRIGNTYIYDKFASPVSKLRLILRLRQKKYDLLVDLRNGLFGLLVGARFCTGPSKKILSKGEGVRHKIDEHIGKIRELGLSASGAQYPVWISGDDAAKTASLVMDKGIMDADEIICVAPGAKSHIKRWREEGFAKACDMLIEACKVKVVFIGDDSDKDICDRIVGMMKNYSVSMAGMTNLRELAWIIKRSRLIITNDSAPLHIAGSVGTPAVAIFGPTDHNKYGPRHGAGTAVFKKLHCSPCEVASCRYNLECMKAVTAEEVFDAARKILDERR